MMNAKVLLSLSLLVISNTQKKLSPGEHEIGEGISKVWFVLFLHHRRHDKVGVLVRPSGVSYNHYHHGFQQIVNCDNFTPVEPIITTVTLIIIMLAKTNAVLDGVTTFLKYGTLDSSNSDVRLGELDHPSSV